MDYRGGVLLVGSVGEPDFLGVQPVGVEQVEDPV